MDRVTVTADGEQHAAVRPGRRGPMLLIILVVLAVASLIPFRTTIAPAWRVEVVGASGEPRPSIRVKQSWTYYSLMTAVQSEDRFTDEHGVVVFPQRSIRASAVKRAIGAVREVLATGVHASFGPHAHVLFVVKRGGAPDAVVVELSQAVPWSEGGVLHRQVLPE